MSDEFAEYLDTAFAEDEPVDTAAETEPVEPAAEADPETAEPADDGQPRDETGKFVAKDDVVEQRLKEKDRVIGSMANELGELRKLVEERTAPKPEPSQFANQPDLEQQIYENPQYGHQACYDAVARGDDATYNRALRAWVEADAPAALLFNQQVLALQMRQQLEAQVSRQVAPAAQAAEAAAAQQAVTNIQAKYPDFKAVVDSLTPEMVQGIVEDPYFSAAELLGRTDLQSQQRILNAVYQEAKLQYGARVDAAAERAASQQAQQAAQTKAQAAVATTTTSSATAAGGTGLFNTGDSDLDSFYEGIVNAGSPFLPGR